MLHLKIALFGLVIVGAVALAVYHHFNEDAILQSTAPPQRRRRRSPPPPRSRTLSQSSTVTQSSDNSSGPMSFPLCSICLLVVSDDIYSKRLTCGHEFHKNCIQDWFNIPRNTCPNCRKQSV